MFKQQNKSRFPVTMATTLRAVLSRRFLMATVLLSLTLRLPRASSYSVGAPDAACVDMTPMHQQTIQSSPSPYTLTPNATSIQGGDRIILTLTASGDPLKGFFIQGRPGGEDGVALGTFFTNKHKTFTCGKGFNNVVTHNNSTPVSSLTIEWEAPSDFEGELIFRGTVVKSYTTYWTNLRSDKIKVMKRSAPAAPPPPVSSTEPGAEVDVPTLDKTNPMTSTEREPAPVETSELAARLEGLYLGCGDSKTCYGYPSGCASEKKCQFMVTYTYVGSGKYEFELKGKGGSDVYVAVGLSFDEFMGDDSVVVCASKGGIVDAYMSFNEGRQNVNILYPKEGLTLLEAGEEEGTLYCRFHRRTRTTPKNMEFDLGSSKFHVMVAYGDINQDSHLYHHGPNKIVSERPVSLGLTSSLKQKNIGFYKQIHAGLMIGAWVGAASCGILFARYYKQTWLRSKCCNIDQWFHNHRFFMILTWLMTMSSLALIAYALGRFSPSDHAYIGLTSIVLCFIQPFMAALRPHPNGKYRGFFNQAHWFVGNSAQILGICAIFFGFEIYLGTTRHWVKTLAWYILIVFIAFHCLVHLILSIAQCVTDRSSGKSSEVYPMKELGGSRTLLQPDDGPMDAPGGCFRKFILTLYLPINWIFTAVLIILVAVDKENLEMILTEWNIPPFWEDLQ